MKSYDLEKDFGIKPESLLKKQPQKSTKRPPQRQRLIMIISSLTIAVILGFILLPSKYKDEVKKEAEKNTSAQMSETQMQTETQAPTNDKVSEPSLTFIKSVKLLPTNPTIKDPIKANIEFIKPENSSDIKVKYEWYKNNTHIIEGVVNDTLPAGLVQKGNFVNVRVYAIKNGQTVQVINSDMIMIVNSPPSLTMSVINNKVKKNEPIMIQLKAEDPEGDKITFALDDAPNGMSIDQSTGMITYFVDKPVQGSVRFRASATDSEGAKVSGTFEISFSVHQEQ
ncbi:MAG: putative Ig domain-containing protein [Thermodesulfovibrionales bacterium]|nr:putative Ig domain-containing protein [Thermodesulfovibrionales bacterium]